jgi:hypothetical protein
MSSFPSPSAVKQKSLVAHDTELIVEALWSTYLGAAHVLPLNVTTFPPKPAATQKELVGHDTE